MYRFKTAWISALSMIEVGAPASRFRHRGPLPSVSRSSAFGGSEGLPYVRSQDAW